MALLVSADALVVYTSTSRPTVELNIKTASGGFGRASLPLGYEDSLLNGSKPRLHKLVLETINALAPRILVGKEIVDQGEFDRCLCEATEDLKDQKLRVKVRYLVSVAYAKACSSDRRMLLHEYLAEMGGFDAYRGLPVPMITLISGGQVATTPFRVQAIMIVPVGASSLPDAIRAGSEISEALSVIFKTKGWFYAIGDEGGFSTNFDGRGSKTILCSALNTVMIAIENAGYKQGTEIRIAIDFAAKYCDLGKGRYALVTEEEALSAADVIELCEFISDNFPILLIEDPVSDADLAELKDLHKRLMGKTFIAADDLLEGSASGIAAGNPWDAVVVKPDQVGTISTTLDFVASVREAGYVPIASHRSGETEDVLLSDMAAALSLPFVKAGGMSGSERMSKYNELLRISELYERDHPILDGCLGGEDERV